MCWYSPIVILKKASATILLLLWSVRKTLLQIRIFFNNFNVTILQLVTVYAPWCGHCKKLAPEYEIAATKLKANDPPVALVKVDCTVETETCKTYGVSGYPTLKIFKNGQKSADYDGPREADGIVKFMKARAGPASKELNSVADAEKFLANFEHSVVGFFSSVNSKFAKEFKSVAEKLSEKYRFAYTSNKEVMEKYNHKE
jgi:protein disulfide isomerase family A protein 3